MKYLLILVFVLIATLAAIIPGYGEAMFEEHIIVDNLGTACTISAADLDGDEDIDIVLTSHQNNFIMHLRNNGDLTFEQEMIVENFGNARVIDLAYINDEDQYFDVVATADADDKISWFKNDGNGNFTEYPVVENWESAGFVVGHDHYRDINVDINGDGYTDLVAGSIAPGNRLSWFENDGEENFTEHILKEDWEWVRRGCAFDIDFDGDQDIIASAKTGEIIIFENINQDDNFIEHIVVSDWGWPNHIMGEDMDGDGDIDLVSATVVVNEVAWFEQTMPLIFEKHVIKEDYAGAFSPIITDIDEDQDFDVLAIAWQGAQASFFENDGELNFSERRFCTTAFDLIRIFVVDLDRDEDLDIIGSSAAGSNPDIRWWESLNSFIDGDFYGEPLTGHAPLTVNFTEDSYNKPDIFAWAWDMDSDGTTDCTTQSPEYTYDTPGEYTVSLELGNGLDTDEIVKENYIKVFDGESCIDFNNTYSYLEVDSDVHFNLTDEFTMEAWIYPTGYGTNPNWGGKIFDKDAISLFMAENLALVNPRSLAVTMTTVNGSTTGSTPSDVIPLDAWSHIALAYDGQACKIFINGIEQELTFFMQNNGNVVDNASNPLHIGNEPPSQSNFEGKIDEVRIWDIVRTSQEINTTMQDYLTGNENGLIAYWKMNEGNGSIIEDCSANNYPLAVHLGSWAQGTHFQMGLDSHYCIGQKESTVIRNYPNPFNPSTQIEYYSPVPANAEISLYNIKGQLITTLLNANIRAGAGSVIWDGTDSKGQQLGSGIYFYRLVLDGKVSGTGKCLMVK